MSKNHRGRVDWDVYLQRGVIVELQIQRYRGVSTFDFSELGLRVDDSDELKSFISSYLRPGKKRLLPPDIDNQLSSIETLARQNLESCSFPCDAFATQGKFVPESSYLEFKRRNQELCARFYGIRDNIVSNYSDLIDRIKDDYTIFAKELWEQENGSSRKGKKAFIDGFVGRIASQIPSVEEISASFKYNTFLHKIPERLLDVIREQKNESVSVVKLAAAVQPHIPKEHQENIKKAKEENISMKPSSNKNQSNNKKKTKNVKNVENVENDSIESNVNVQERIANDIRDSVREQASAVSTSFLTDVVMSLRIQAFQGAEQILLSIDKNDGKLVGRASTKAHSLISDLRKMDFYGDSDLEEILDWLEYSLDGTENRDMDDIKSALTEMRKWAFDSIQYLQNRGTNDNQGKHIKRTKTQLKMDAIVHENNNDNDDFQLKGKHFKKTAKHLIDDNTDTNNISNDDKVFSKNTNNKNTSKDTNDEKIIKKKRKMKISVPKKKRRQRNVKKK